jgi:hypothetical protein
LILVKEVLTRPDWGHPGWPRRRRRRGWQQELLNSPGDSSGPPSPRWSPKSSPLCFAALLPTTRRRPRRAAPGRQPAASRSLSPWTASRGPHLRRPEGSQQTSGPETTLVLGKGPLAIVFSTLSRGCDRVVDHWVGRPKRLSCQGVRAGARALRTAAIGMATGAAMPPQWEVVGGIVSASVVDAAIGGAVPVEAAAAGSSGRQPGGTQGGRCRSV